MLNYFFLYVWIQRVGLSALTWLLLHENILQRDILT